MINNLCDNIFQPPGATRFGGAGIPGSGYHYGRGAYAHKAQPRLGFTFKPDTEQNQNLDFVTCFKVSSF